MKPATITEVRRLVEAHGAKQGILILFDLDGKYAGTSYGDTRESCALVKGTLDDICRKLSEGSLLSPDAPMGWRW